MAAGMAATLRRTDTHVPMLSQPDVVADFIAKAAAAL
jgi:hypothetical protein